MWKSRLPRLLLKVSHGPAERQWEFGLDRFPTRVPSQASKGSSTLSCVGTLARAWLSADERSLLERFVAELGARLGRELYAVWLFGSRARGELPRDPDSDVDLLVLAGDVSWEGKRRVFSALDTAARDLGLEALSWSFSVHVNTPEWLAGRREIRSFFIAEVDRDKVVLCGLR